MKNTFWLALLLLLPSGALRAQPVSVGGHGIYAWGLDLTAGGGTGMWGAGGSLLVRVGSSLQIMAIGDYYFPDCQRDVECTVWGASVSLVSGGGGRGMVRPRVGVGAAYSNRRRDDPSSTELSFDRDGFGLNFLVDVELALLPVVKPYGQLRLETIKQFQTRTILAAGIRF